MDDHTLIKKLQSGRRRALETAIRRYTPYVNAVIANTLKGRAAREDAEELVSDVFISLWRHASELDATRELRPWLAAVARNAATDWLRRQSPTEPLPDADTIPDPSDGPSRLAERREWAGLLWGAVNGLTEPDRTLFLRYYYEGEKLKDIASELGMSQTSAKQRLYRGRKLLKKHLLAKGVDAV